ncbi:helix-turn-helix transcriptional regulator [Mucilaginibacter sp. 14171R-50]|uniref:helix-turn-helix domain-containing protein n=1 Tax=Mucilaginibacter sp. 14171R-50 TaxID=2703789 RepID=UPI00138C5F1D|nr:helix-turn-helix transcriptional regulator [Mucilaginibacter sp. 14171R-50]
MKDKFIIHYETVGRNVRYFRFLNGWTQAELAHRCSVNAEQISRIENARRDYMHSTLLEVCEALEKSIFEIMQRNDDAELYHLEYVKKKEASKKKKS